MAKEDGTEAQGDACKRRKRTRKGKTHQSQGWREESQCQWLALMQPSAPMRS